MFRIRTILPVAMTLTIAACSGEGESVATNHGDGGPSSITEAEIADHLEILASDEFGGRAPSSPGEELTVAYLADYFRGLGLEPGVGDSYFQTFRSSTSQRTRTASHS